MTEPQPLRDKLVIASPDAGPQDCRITHQFNRGMKVQLEHDMKVFKSAVDGLKLEIETLYTNVNNEDISSRVTRTDILSSINHWLSDLFVEKGEGEPTILGDTVSSSPSNITYQEHKKGCPSCQYTEQNKKVEDGK